MNQRSTEGDGSADRLQNFGIYQLARQLFDKFWEDAEQFMNDPRGRELVRQQTRSLDSICANIEEGFGRGFGKELPQYLRIARGEARESKGRYERLSRLISRDVLLERQDPLNHIIGGLTKTIVTLERRKPASPATRPTPQT
jgi:four helix bundle protein